MIKAIITDFDGTLVDTFDANFRAYQEAFKMVNIELTQERYRQCFGYRFDNFMLEMGISEQNISDKIREIKKEVYPNYFQYLNPNYSLIDLISTFHNMGGKTAIASTARRENLLNAINFLGIEDFFDLVYAAEDVKQGKPSPEIYLNAMAKLNVISNEVLIFEDSPVGFESAIASGARYIPVTDNWFIK